MMQRLMIAGIAVAAFGSCALAAAPSPVDGQFTVKASISNTFETSSSELALLRSQDPRVRAFARRMIADHSKAQAKLDGASHADDADAGRLLDDAHEQLLSKLSSLSGADFDQAYMADQVQAHQETLAMLDDFAVSGSDPALRAWAAMTRPIVAMHLSMAETISGT